MQALTITASTIANGCGIGWDAVRTALHESRSGLRRNDFDPAQALDTWVGRVDGLESQRLPPRFADADCRNNRLARLCLEQDGFVARVRSAAARLGADRIGVFVGTSTSGILSTELAYRSQMQAGAGVAATLTPELYRNQHSLYATTAFVRGYLNLAGPAMTISTACSSSAKVFAAAARSIAAGLCDAAVVGGVDSLALSTLFGFHALGLLSRQPCRPFAADRDGISIGEGAGFALLQPAGAGAIALIGVGESADAFHMSSPHPDGAGAAAAMRAALLDAGLSDSAIDYINLHGTASRANDLAEDRAVTTVFGTHTSASSTKGWTGHTLGAAGITEALICHLALAEQWQPQTLNCEVVDPLLRCDIQVRPRSRLLRHALSNSFGFAGSNCSLVFGLAA